MWVAVMALAACADECLVSECDDLPVVTWDSFGEGILNENCQVCHASTALDRHGAPESVTFDTEEQALAFREDILRVTNPEARTMPPSIALEDDDYQRLYAWLTCDE